MKKLKPIILSVWALISTSTVALAQNTTSATTSTSETFAWDKMDQFINYISNSLTDLLLDFLFPMAGVIVVGMIIWGGFKYIQGDPETGKKTITAAIIGLVIVVLSSLIVNEINDIISGDFEAPEPAAIEGGNDSDTSPIGEGSPFGGESSPAGEPPPFGSEAPDS